MVIIIKEQSNDAQYGECNLYQFVTGHYKKQHIKHFAAKMYNVTIKGFYRYHVRLLLCLLFQKHAKANRQTWNEYETSEEVDIQIKINEKQNIKMYCYQISDYAPSVHLNLKTFLIDIWANIIL